MTSAGTQLGPPQGHRAATLYGRLRSAPARPRRAVRWRGGRRPSTPTCPGSSSPSLAMSRGWAWLSTKVRGRPSWRNEQPISSENRAAVRLDRLQRRPTARPTRPLPRLVRSGRQRAHQARTAGQATFCELLLPRCCLKAQPLGWHVAAAPPAPPRPACCGACAVGSCAAARCVSGAQVVVLSMASADPCRACIHGMARSTLTPHPPPTHPLCRGLLPALAPL